MAPLRLLLLGAAALPTALQAQVAPVTRSVPVIASAPAICAIREPAAAPGGQINFRGINGNTLQIDHLVDPATLAAAAASVDI
ncbi:MAG TPA: hypothetical protein VEW26_15460, partial [Allosphingosinicella sp.]|nr:hypothetical protein [Allosphingosinicella sp.]